RRPRRPRNEPLAAASRLPPAGAAQPAQGDEPGGHGEAVRAAQGPGRRRDSGRWRQGLPLRGDGPRAPDGDGRAACAADERRRAPPVAGEAQEGAAEQEEESTPLVAALPPRTAADDQ